MADEQNLITETSVTDIESNTNEQNNDENNSRRDNSDINKNYERHRHITHTRDNEHRDRKYNQKRVSTNGGKTGSFRNIEEKIYDRLASLCGSTFDLQPADITEKKFAGRNRLFVGNLPSDITMDEFKDMFKPFGETSEIFINNDKSFGFVRLDFYVNAERASISLNGTMIKGRAIKVRFAPNNSTIKVLNLSPFVTNELLYVAFAVFGEIERCVVFVDERGKSLCKGIVEFARKPAAQLALKHCMDGCFFLTSSLRPIVVEYYEHIDSTHGYAEKQLQHKTLEYEQARNVGPRFALPGSFEYDYGTRWKKLHELYKQKSMFLKQELKMEEDKLEAQMQFAKFEHETEMLRKELRARELNAERKKREWEERERLALEERERLVLEQCRQQQSEGRAQFCDDMFRRQEENNLYRQAHQLANILDQQEEAVVQTLNSPYNQDEQGSSDGHTNPVDPKPFIKTYYEARNRDDIRSPSDSNSGRGGGHWSNDMHRDEYEYTSKRRRY